MDPPVPVTCLGPPDEALRFPHSKSHFRRDLMPGGFAVLVIVRSIPGLFMYALALLPTHLGRPSVLSL
jgi:hypothetical protein